MQKNSLNAQFTSFPDPENEAAKGNLDVVSASAASILKLVAETRRWVIISRNAYMRVALLVPPSSGAKRIADLRGRRIGLHWGTTGHSFIRTLAREQQLLGKHNVLVASVDVEALTSWGDLDAIATWEPSITLFEHRRFGRVLREKNEVTLTAMSKDFIQKHPREAAAYVRSTLDAWAYYASHHQEMNEQYIKAAHLTVNSELLENVARNEPNASVRSSKEVDLSLSPQMLKQLEDTMSGMLDIGGIVLFQFSTRADGTRVGTREYRAPPISEFVNQELLSVVRESLS